MSDHYPFPAFLYGTAWKEEDTRRCVENALRAGFRGIDTANQRKHYHEAAVGEALRAAFEQGELKREAIFIQTKFTSRDGQDQRLPYDAQAGFAEQVAQSHQSSLDHLGCTYLDSYVLHGPLTSRGLTPGDWEIWRAMEKLAAGGGVRQLGISNVDLGQLRLLVADASVKPAFVQNRCFARTKWDREVRAFCSEHAIRYQGFSLLTANRSIFERPRFTEIVRRSRLTPAQVVFAFSLGAGMLPLTGTTDPAHMSEDLLALDRRLSAEDQRAMENITEA